jgi:RHS repeat-associated protein
LSGANCWGNSYTIDPWGNLTNKTVTKCSAEMLSAAPATLQNQLPGFQYDLAGNMVVNGSATYTYDAENQIKTAGGVTYVYDGDGKRVNKSLGRLYWYGTGSDSLTETDGSGNLLREFVYFNGKRTARIDLPGGTVHYYFADHLGTLSEEASATGTIENDSDYYPYGGERVIKQNVANEHYKFGGKERDAESNLDEFGARYYASSLGRFMQPDWAAAPTAVPYAKYGNPQSLNLYSYVENNPTGVTDPNGHGDATGGYCDANRCYSSPADVRNGTTMGDAALQGLGLGALAAGIFSSPAVAGSIFLRNLLGLGLATAPTTVPIINGAIEGLTPGQSLTLRGAEALGVGGIEYLGEKGFVGSLENGARISAGFEKVGDALGVNISNIQSAARGSINFKALESGAENLAKSEGASSLTITATNVTNSKLAQTLEKAGYTAQQVTDKFGRTTVNYVKRICTASGGCQ